MSTTSLRISLPEPLEEFVREQVRDGAYDDPSDYIRALVRADRERKEKYADLKRDIGIGLEQLERGEARPFDDRLVEEVKTRGRGRLNRPS